MRWSVGCLQGLATWGLTRWARSVGSTSRLLPRRPLCGWCWAPGVLGCCTRSRLPSHHSLRPTPLVQGAQESDWFRTLRQLLTKEGDGLLPLRHLPAVAQSRLSGTEGPKSAAKAADAHSPECHVVLQLIELQSRCRIGGPLLAAEEAAALRNLPQLLMPTPALDALLNVFGAHPHRVDQLQVGQPAPPTVVAGDHLCNRLGSAAVG